MASKGSIEHRNGDAYRLIVSCGIGSDGKQVKKTKTVHAKTPTEAQKLLQQFIDEIDGGFDTDAGKLTFERFVNERWIPKHAEKELAPKTVYDKHSYFSRTGARKDIKGTPIAHHRFFRHDPKRWNALR